MSGVVLATRALPEPSLSTLAPDFEVRILSERPDEKDLAREVAGAGAFGMTVIACGRSPRDEDDPDDPPRVSFDELLRRSDVVSIHLPLNEETRHLFDAETFAKMKAGSWLLNTSRGAIVDEAALAR